ncbi:MAG: serine--tRNA ligase [Bacteroidales bacterium]|jgi:seryl-tRNA synthetase|nr:serine--tRNA ligase [Lentimicrobiaceae bacterium]MDG1135847.1 serine--tRNA ligase [Bacteroidales bacterium]MDG1901831.1 serine--tRNA ligase [Bacteroidales bacterium]MDG2081154.1 serine--tRNA ligase [Bacteroidales bacterium]|tara:strand:+ start:9963 stop:11234 length:1272 start_codon:yes stop_codon:yes gene_type:complete
MLELNFIHDNKAEIIDRLAIKNFDASNIIEEIIELDIKRKATQTELDKALAETNKLAKEIGILYKTGQREKAEEIKNRSGELKLAAKDLEQALSNNIILLNEKLVELPNIPHETVPAGKSDSDNELVYEEGNIPSLPNNAKPHWELASEYDIIDFDLGSKVTGAGFPFYKGKGARLQRALINFFLDEAIEKGYIEYQPPLLINSDSAYGTGQLPDKEGQMYHINEDGLYLIPTAEVPITNIYRNVILKSEDFPIKNVAYSNCFRREAGSYGKDVRGLNRLHQFDKVEIVQIQSPEKSYETLEEMKDQIADLLIKLELPFRIVRLCGGDLSFTSALTYDFEVYSAAQKRWLEVSSVSNFESFQSNRMKLRFKDKDGKSQFAHTLNGSALALPRIVAALLENNQTNEGIRIPQALQGYTKFDIIS